MIRIPTVPKFTLAALGPGIVLIAMGLGSGEYILWPYIVTQVGFGVIWGALVGITLQYFLSHEAGRYTLATGGSVYVAFSKLSRILPGWFIISTFLSFAWPGIIASGGNILGGLLGITDHKWLTIAMLIAIGILLTFGGKVYNTLEKFQKIGILITIPLLVIIAIAVTDTEAIHQILLGFIGVGNNYHFFPSSLSLLSFLGAVAYAGAGGNLVLSHSFYLQDAGMGAARNVDTQLGASSVMAKVHLGQMPEMTKENVSQIKGWMRFTYIEQLVSFWLIGLASILLLTVIAYQLTYPYAGGEGLGFVTQQASVLASRFGDYVGVFFLLIGVIFLFTTQLGIFETTSRIMSENLQLMSSRISERFSRSRIFYTFLWAQIITAVGISLLGLEQPIQLLLISTFFSALSMFALSGLLFLLGRSPIFPKEIQLGRLKGLILIISFLFYGGLVAVTVASWF